MKKILLLNTLLLLALSLSAQPPLDSLWGVWNDEGMADSTRLEAIQLIGRAYSKTKHDSALGLYQLQYDFAEKVDSKKYMISSLQAKGNYWRKEGDIDKAIECYEQNLKITGEINDKKGMATALIVLGIIYRNHGEYAKAINSTSQSLEISQELGDKRYIAGCLNNIGLTYWNQGNNSKAIDYYIKSLKLSQELNDKTGVGQTLNNIGNIYSDIGDYSKALDYYDQSLKIKEELGDTEGAAICLSNIGIMYEYLGDYPKALDYSYQSLKIKEEFPDKKSISHTLLPLGSIYMSMGDYPKALEYFTKSLDLREELNDIKGMAICYNKIGNLYLKLNSSSKAISWCKKALDISEEIEIIASQREACNCLYEAYKSLGKGNEALEYFERTKILADSLNKEETAKKLQQMEFAKQMLADSLVREEEKLIVKHAYELEVKKKDLQRKIFLALVIFVLLIAVGLYGSLRYVRISRAIIQKEKDSSENLLLNILPAEIAKELKEKGKADARNYDMVSILFTDFKEFTQASSKLSARELLFELNNSFEAFDRIIGKHGIEKIKTIGDAYMAAGGLPVPNADFVKNTVLAALEMQAFIVDRKKEMQAKGMPSFEMRAGIHTGPVVAGIVGVKKFQYDVWGNTVNIASRMESNGEVGKVNISQTTYELINDDPDFSFEKRGQIEVKGKGLRYMYFVGLAIQDT